MFYDIEEDEIMLKFVIDKKAQIEIHRASSRGYFDYGWLKTSHSFSFARYFEPDKIHFGALRVLNDDVIEAGKGFGSHPHDNMEIITIPIEGELKHEDSMGSSQIIRTNEVQVMSAGTGIFHSEENSSFENDVKLFQIWIFPKERNIVPIYHQAYFNPDDAKNEWQLLVGEKDSDAELTINQNATVKRSFLDKGNTLTIITESHSFGNYLFVVDGKISIEDIILGKRDAVGIENNGIINITALENSYLLNIEIPDAPSLF